MISKKLLDDIIPHLKEAEEIWIAVALMNEFGLSVVENAPEDCKKNILVGLDLPTSPSVLHRLLSLKSDIIISKVFISNKTFHPKVYIIRKKGNRFIAYVGSANATNGGLINNVELSLYIEDLYQCQQLIDWFNECFSDALLFDRNFIEKYEQTYKRNKSLGATQKSNNDKLKAIAQAGSGVNLIVSGGQFFEQADFEAYDPLYHYDASNFAVNKRAAVRLKFLELNNRIFPRFTEYGLNDLYLPENRRNYTSYHWHSRGNTHIAQDAIWLNYGKSPHQLSVSHGHKFVDNIRIQIILRHTSAEAYIGIWLFIGKPNGSYWDRKYLKEKIKDQGYLLSLYEYILALGGAYWVNIADEDLWVSDLENPQQLYDFLIEDTFSDYFIIGRNYQPNDNDLSDSNIEETVLIEFTKLYKLYELIKYK